MSLIHGVVALICAGTLIGPIALFIWHYCRTHYRHALVFCGGWVAICIYAIFDGVSAILEDSLLFILAQLVATASVFFQLLSIDVLGRESLDVKKYVVWSCLTTAVVIYGLQPGAAVGAYWGTEEFRLSFGILTLMMTLTYLVFWLRLAHATPKALRHPKRLLYIGAIFPPLGPIITALFDPLSEYGEHILFLAFSAILISYVLLRYPKIAFLLPFRALRLAVIETEGGIPLFTHTWKSGSNLISEDLFSGMLQGVTTIVRESLQRGRVSEIRADQALLIIQYAAAHPVAFVLATTRSSPALRTHLDVFATRFVEEFRKGIANPSVVSQFSAADHLVSECFPFIPEFD